MIVGLGNNVQTIQVNLLKGLSKLGMKIQRIQHQPTPANGSFPFESLGLRPMRWYSENPVDKKRIPFFPETRLATYCSVGPYRIQSSFPVSGS